MGNLRKLKKNGKNYMAQYDEEIDRIINELGGLMKKNEYQAIAKAISQVVTKRGPINLLASRSVILLLGLPLSLYLISLAVDAPVNSKTSWSQL